MWWGSNLRITGTSDILSWVMIYFSLKNSTNYSVTDGSLNTSETHTHARTHACTHTLQCASQMHNVYIKVLRKDSPPGHEARGRPTTFHSHGLCSRKFTQKNKWTINQCCSWVVLTLSSLDSNSHTSPSTSSMVALWGQKVKKKI